MKKRFYEEPEITVMKCNLIYTIDTSPDGDLGVGEVFPGDGDGTGSGGGDGGDFSWPY